MLRVERDVIAESVERGQRIRPVARNALAHPAVRINRRCDPVVGVPQNPSPIFDRPHAGHVQVLPWSARIAVPTIVADIHQHLGAQASELPHLVGKNSLIADEDAVAMSIEVEDFALLAACKLSDSSGELARKEQKVLEGDVLSKRHEVDFVVAANPDPVRPDDHRGVVVPPGLILR